MFQQAQADSPVTQVSLTKTGFCPDRDQYSIPFPFFPSTLLPKRLFLLVLATLPSLPSRLLRGMGTGEGPAVSLTWSPPTLSFSSQVLLSITWAPGRV